MARWQADVCSRTGQASRAGKLLENRDLQPTCDICAAVAKGLLVEHLDLNQSALNAVFPESGAVTPMRHLVVT